MYDNASISAILNANLPVITKKLNASFNKAFKKLDANKKSIVKTYNVDNDILPDFCKPSSLRYLPNGKYVEVKSISVLDNVMHIPGIRVVVSTKKDKHNSVMTENFVKNLSTDAKSDVDRYLAEGTFGAHAQLSVMELAFYNAGMDIDSRGFNDDDTFVFDAYFPTERIAKKKDKFGMVKEFYEEYSEEWFKKKIAKM